MRVDGRCVEPRVAENPLNRTQAGATVQKVGGARVAQEVAAALEGDAGTIEMPADELAEGGFREPVAVAGHEQGGVRGRQVSEYWAGVLEVFANPGKGPLSGRNDALFAAFALSANSGYLTSS